MNNGIIAIGAHPDDIELGCGASLTKLASKGFNVYSVVLSAGDKGNPVDFDRIKEAKNGLNHLGITQTFFLDFEDTKLGLHLHDIIYSLENILKNLSHLNINRVYTMFKDDRHQDHRATYEASIVAFRKISQILCYETPSSGTQFQPQVFEEIDDNLLDKKIAAIKLHKSQLHRNYMSEHFIKSLATLRGHQAGYTLSEGFVPYKMVL